MYKHRRTFDFSAMKAGDRKRLQPALEKLDYPVERIRRNMNARVPVTMSDLGRFQGALGRTGHAHVHQNRIDERGQAYVETGHLLGVEEGPAGGRRQRPLGLYWLPTPQFPAGRIELDEGLSDELAQEVLIAESAHALDYGWMTAEQRKVIMDAYHEGSSDPEDWFEEHGSEDYWDWTGESFMIGFAKAFAPGVATTLGDRFVHKTTPKVIETIKRVMR